MFYFLFTKNQLRIKLSRSYIPSIYLPIQTAIDYLKMMQFTICLRTSLLYLPIRRGIFASKKTPSHFTRDFAGIIMQTKFSPLHLYKSSFQRQVTTLTHKIFLLAYIKATVKAFWWGALLKFPHLIATRMAFWLGVFSKIQSMFTNSLSPNSLEKKQNLRLQRKHPHLLPRNCHF